VKPPERKKICVTELKIKGQEKWLSSVARLKTIRKGKRAGPGGKVWRAIHLRKEIVAVCKGNNEEGETFSALGWGEFSSQ